MKVDLPRLALSVRQPWAHCLVAGGKPVENRSWRAGNPGLRFRGSFAIHASTGMTRDEYEGCADLCEMLGYQLPPPAALPRGGIVGAATVTDIVTRHDSDWFFGPLALVIADAQPVDFIPVGGQLGFFDWRKLLLFCKDTGPVPPAKWMLPEADRAPAPKRPRIVSPTSQGTLL